MLSVPRIGGGRMAPQRQLHGDGGAVALARAAGGDGPAVHLHQGLDDRQAQPQPDEAPWRNRSNRYARKSREMPMPVSDTVISTLGSLRRVAMRTSPPRSVNLI